MKIILISKSERRIFEIVGEYFAKNGMIVFTTVTGVAMLSTLPFEVVK